MGDVQWLFCRLVRVQESLAKAGFESRVYEPLFLKESKLIPLASTNLADEPLSSEELFLELVFSVCRSSNKVHRDIELFRVRPIKFTWWLRYSIAVPREGGGAWVV